LPYYSRL